MTDLPDSLRKAEELPNRRPPAMLSREEAAAYVGVSATVFDEEVAAGMWPQPIRRGRKGKKPTWSVAALDARITALDAMNPLSLPPAGSPPPAQDAAPVQTEQQQQALRRLRAGHG